MARGRVPRRQLQIDRLERVNQFPCRVGRRLAQRSFKSVELLSHLEISEPETLGPSSNSG